MKKIASLLLTITLVFGQFASPVYGASRASAAPNSEKQQEEPEVQSTFDKLEADAVVDKSEELMDTHKPEDEVTVIVELKQQGFFSRLFSSEESYHEKIQNKIKSLTNESKASTYSLKNNNGLELRYDYYTVLNGFSIKVQYKYLQEIKDLESVKRAFVEDVYTIPDDQGMQEGGYINQNSLAMVDAGANGYLGEGSVVAVIDSGLDTNHEAFVDNLDDSTLGLTKEDIDMVKDKLHGDGVYINDKIPFAYDYADGDSEVIPSDSSLSHGTHVAGIIAANGGDTILGVAPRAQIVVLKVASDGLGTIYTSDMVAALEDATNLGVDAVNMSLGSEAGFSKDSNEAWNEVYEAVREKGIVLDVAAGNAYTAADQNKSGLNLPYASDPDSSIVASPSTYASSTSVASVDANTSIFYFLDVQGNKISYAPSDNIAAPTFSSLNGVYDFVDCGYGHEDEIPAEVSGKVAVMQRGSDVSGEQFYYSTKVQNAINKGAVAVVVYDYANSGTEGLITMTVEPSDIPAVFITNESGLSLLSQENKQITISPAYEEENFDYTMSEFSSLGVNSDLTLKPEITAPGGNIFSSVLDGQYDYMSGTSMATPHMAGLSAALSVYVRENFSDLSKAEQAEMITTLLMNTATPVKDGDSYYTPRKQGAGLASLEDATNTSAYITVEGSTDGKPKANLGDSKEGSYSFTFTIHNISDKELEYHLETAALSEKTENGYFTLHSTNYAGKGIDITYKGLDNGKVTVPANQEVTITVSLKANDSFKEAVKEAVNGTFIDGFVMLKGQNSITDLSIPFLGFYGDWSDIPIFDETKENNKAHMFASYAYGTNSGYELGKNVYQEVLAGTSQVYYDRFVIAPDGVGNIYGSLSTATGLIRNAKELQYTVTPKGDDSTIIQQYVYDNVVKSYYVANAGQVSYAEAFLDTQPIFKGLDQNNKEVEDGWYTYSIKALADDGDEVVDDTYSFDFYYDTTVPVLESTTVVEEDGVKKVHIVLSDEHYISGLELLTNSSTSLGILFEKDAKKSYEQDGRYYYEYDLDYEEIKSKLAEESWSWQNMIYIYAYDYGVNCLQDKVVLEDAYPESISFNESSLTLTVGQEANLTYNIWPDNVTKKDLSFTSSDEQVATCDEMGQVVAVGAGNTTITLTSTNDKKETISTTCEVTVNAITKEDGLVLSSSSLKVTEGQNFSLKATLHEDLQGQKIEWSVSEESVVKITGTDNQKVELTALEAGRTEVKATVTTADNTYEAVCKVNVETEDAADFVVDENGVLTSYLGNRTMVVIPGNVTEIGDYVFSWMDIQEVYIPESVKRIGNSAFYYCQKLKVVSMADNSVETMGDNAFYNCNSLESIVLPSSLRQLGAGAFSSTLLKELVIPDGVTEIPNNLVNYCTQLTKVQLPETITKIGDGAFGATGYLTDINLPDSITYIGDSAFAACALKEFVAPKNLKYLGKQSLSTTKCSITLNEGLETIGDSAFMAAAIKELVIPDSVTSVGSQVLVRCPNLERVVIGKNINQLIEPFVECGKLKDIVLSEGNTAFVVKDKVLFSSDMKTLITYPIGIAAADTSYKIPDEVETVASYAFFNTRNLSEIIFGENTRKLENYSLSQTGIKTLVDTNNVEYIGTNAFTNCGDLTQVIIGDKVKLIDSYAFTYDNMISSFIIGKNVEKIGKQALSALESLPEIVFPDNVIEIGDSVLINDRALKEVTFGKNISKINSSMLTNTASLERIIVSEENPYYYTEEGCLYGKCEDNKLSVVMFAPQSSCEEYVAPDNVIEVQDNAFKDAKKLKSATFTEGLLKLGTGAFNGCTNLEKLNLPDSLQSLGAFFMASTKVKTLVLGTQLANMDYNALSFAESLETLAIKGANGVSLSYTIAPTNLKTVYLGPGVSALQWWTFHDALNLKNVIINGDIGTIDPEAFPSSAVITFYVNPDTTSYQAIKSMNAGKVVDYTPLSVEATQSKMYVEPGDKVSLQALAKGGFGNKVYRFTEVTSEGEVLLQDYSESSMLKDVEVSENSKTIRVYTRDDSYIEAYTDYILAKSYANGAYISTIAVDGQDGELISMLLSDLVHIGINDESQSAVITVNDSYIDIVKDIKVNGNGVSEARYENGVLTISVDDVAQPIKVTIELTNGKALSGNIYVDIDSVVVEASKEDLDKGIAEAYKLNGARYTEATWAALEEALNNAVSVKNNPWALGEEIEKVTHQLENAIDQLARNDLPSYVWPEAGIYDIRANCQDGGISEGFMNMIQKLQLEVTADESYYLYITYQAAEVNGLVRTVDDIESIEYRDSNWNDYYATLENKDEAKGTATYKLKIIGLLDRTMVETALKDILMHQVVYITVNEASITLPHEDDKADKSELLAIYNPYSRLDMASFIDDDQKTSFVAVLAEAKVILADKESTQEQVDDMTNKLRTAFEALHINASIEGLQSLVDYLETLDSNKYVPSSFEELSSLIADAKALIAESQHEKEAMNSIMQQLVLKAVTLVERANKVALEEKIKQAESIDLSLYTDDSVENLKAWLAKANALLDNEEISAEQQDAVNQMVIDLDNAINSLVEKKTDIDDPEGGDKDEPEKPGDEGSDTEDESSAKTGDTMNLNLYYFLLIGSAAVIAYAASKRRSLLKK